MYIVLNLKSTQKSVTLNQWVNKSPTFLTLTATNVDTNSTTRNNYYIVIKGLYTDQIVSNVTSEAAIPVPVGSDNKMMELSPASTLTRTYQYAILDETGQPTTDEVVVNMLFKVD